MEIDDDISIIGGGLDTVEHDATESKGCGRFLKVNDQLVHTSLGIFGIEGFERHCRYLRGRGGYRNLNYLCDLVLAFVCQLR